MILTVKAASCAPFHFFVLVQLAGIGEHESQSGVGVPMSGVA